MHRADRPRNYFALQSSIVLLAMLCGNIALAVGPLFVRMAASEAHIGPVAAGFWRLALAVPVLLLFTRMDRRFVRQLDRRLIAVIALGGVFFAADLGTWHLGILKTKLANATLLGNVASLLFPLYGFIIARAMPSRFQGAALALAAFGGVLLMGRSYELSPQYLAGDLLCLLAGLFYTLYLIAIDRARGAIDPWRLLTLSTIAGVLPLLVFALLLGEPIWPDRWWPLIALTLVSQLIGQGLLVYTMGHVRPLVTGLMFLMQPVVAAAIGWIGYGEALTVADWIGAGAVAAAIVLVRRPAAG